MDPKKLKIELEKILSSDKGAYEAGEILRIVAGISIKDVLSGKDIAKERADECIAYAKRRKESGMPLGYILGVSPFFGRDFYVDENCLIPRADSEILVECALSVLKGNDKIADLCSGSGCLFISLLCEREKLFCRAFDISAGACEAAKKNAEKFGVLSRCEISVCDIIKNDVLGDDVFDVIISNPPYILSGDIKSLSQEVLFEPLCALDGGADGLDFYREIAKKYMKNLKPNGNLLLECGYDTAENCAALFCDAGYKTEIFCDYGGNERVVKVTKKQSG